MSPRGVFVTGTDTGVGKTEAACLLTSGLASSGLKVAVMKPVAAGAQPTADGLRNEDALALIACANVHAAYETVNPFCLREAIAPHIAAAEEGIHIRTADIVHHFGELMRRGETDIYAKVTAAVDRVVLETVLRYVKGNQMQASEVLGISRTTLRAKMRSLGLAIEKHLLSDSGSEE